MGALNPYTMEEITGGLYDWLEAKLLDLCDVIIIGIFAFFFAKIAQQIIRCILDIVMAPRFGFKICSASVFGFIFIRDNHKWKVSFHHVSPDCQCRIGYDLKKPIPEDSFEREKRAAYLTCALEVSIGILMAFVFWTNLSGLSLDKWELLWNNWFDLFKNFFLTGMVFFSVVDMGSGIYVFQVSAKRMTGYVNRAIQKIRQGYSFEELSLKPMEELGFKNVTTAEKLVYYNVYVYYLLAVGQMEELDKVSAEIAEMLESREFSMNEGGLYYWLLYYYSKYYIDALKADQILKKVWPVLSNDSDANAKRVLAQYYYRIRGDVNKARECLQEGLACVDDYAIGAERELERKLLENLAEELGMQNV